MRGRNRPGRDEGAGAAGEISLGARRLQTQHQTCLYLGIVMAAHRFIVVDLLHIIGVLAIHKPLFIKADLRISWSFLLCRTTLTDPMTSQRHTTYRARTNPRTNEAAEEQASIVVLLREPFHHPIRTMCVQVPLSTFQIVPAFIQYRHCDSCITPHFSPQPALKTLPCFLR